MADSFSSEDASIRSIDFARAQDAHDALKHLRQEFIVPSKADLKSRQYGPARPAGSASGPESEPCIYMCGNSLGLQPRRTRDYVAKYLDTWASKGVYGHFKQLEGGLPEWLHLDDAIKSRMATIVGALPDEVVVMETLTANLHLLMASFYRPTKERYKIIIESKAFPSDHVRC